MYEVLFKSFPQSIPNIFYLFLDFLDQCKWITIIIINFSPFFSSFLSSPALDHHQLDRVPHPEQPPRGAVGRPPHRAGLRAGAEGPGGGGGGGGRRIQGQERWGAIKYKRPNCFKSLRIPFHSTVVRTYLLNNLVFCGGPFLYLLKPSSLSCRQPTKPIFSLYSVIPLLFIWSPFSLSPMQEHHPRLHVQKRVLVLG